MMKLPNGTELTPEQMEDKIISMAHLLLECRDALPAITQVQARLHRVDLRLADRIENMLEPWKQD